jgi:ribosomal protein S18 acetylase RimI-like enzyme
MRRATIDDQAVLKGHWEAFEAEVPAPPEEQETWEEEWADVSTDIGGRGAVWIADDDAGSLRATMRRNNVWQVMFAYVQPEARRKGVLHALMREALAEGRARGATRVTLDVLTANEPAVAAWRRLGFEPFSYAMGAPIDAVRVGDDRPPSSGAAYVQTDDHDAVARAVAKYLPRIGRSESTNVEQPRNGWTKVDDELCSRDPKALRRLGRELSLAMDNIVVTLGIEEAAVVRYILWDRGGIADEYASVPEHWGPIPPGDVVALGANPTVAHRLTGADPERLRAVARTAASVEELPPAEKLHAQLAEVLGVG